MFDLVKIWVKAPILKNADLLIVSKCLQWVNPEIFKELSEGRVTLTYCPEEEPQLAYGKIASIVRSSRPKSITVVTIDGSPHCFTLHAAVNEAAYILGEKIPRKHYVVLDAEKLVEISPEAVRIARYLSLVEELIKKNMWILQELKKHSLEYKKALETSDAKFQN